MIAKVRVSEQYYVILCPVQVSQFTNEKCDIGTAKAYLFNEPLPDSQFVVPVRNKNKEGDDVLKFKPSFGIRINEMRPETAD